MFSVLGGSLHPEQGGFYPEWCKALKMLGQKAP